MDMPLSGIVEHSCANLYKPPDDRVYGRFVVLTQERDIPDHMEQIAGKTSDTREEFTNVPFYFTNSSSGLIPALSLIMELDHPHLYAGLWGTTGSASRSVEYVPFQAAVAGNPNEAGDATVFAKLVEAGTGKCRIPPEPKLLEPRQVAVNQRRDKIQDAIG
jgi:hypothetical protein